MNEFDAGHEGGTPGAGLSDMTGRQLGRYLIGDPLGSGGVATVYRAYDQVEGKTVALKLLLPSADEKVYGRFRREAMTAGALRHPNIVRILQVGSAPLGEVAYIAMDLVEGPSLAELLMERRRLRAGESCALLAPIARALAYAHAAGIVHRDVKPNNILLRPVQPGTPNSVRLESLDHALIPLLSDFGIARALDAPELTNAGRTVGTPAYMAPEQCAGRRDIDGRADQYALGAVLYRCVTGRLPFAGATTQILHAHVYEALTIDSEMLRELPPALVAILQRSLAKLPEQRYRDANELAAALEMAALADLPGAGFAADDATATMTMGMPAGVDPTMTMAAPAVGGPRPAGGTQTVLVPGVERTAGAGGIPPAGGPPEGLFDEEGGRSPRRPLAYMLAMLLVGLLVVGGLAAAATAFRRGFMGNVATPTEGAVVALLPTRTPTITPAASAAPTATPNATPNTAATEPAGAATLVIVVPQTPIAPPTNTQPPFVTPLPPPPTDAPTPVPPTPTPTPSPTPTITPTASPTPTITATATQTPTVLVLPTDAPTGEPTPPPPPTPCPIVREGMFEAAIGGMDEETRALFECPGEPFVEEPARLLSFQNGYMLQLGGRPDIFVYAMADDRWERLASGWQPGDPPPLEGMPPPPEGLYLPGEQFGDLWADPRLQSLLGFALAPGPAEFPAVEQNFPGGLLVGDRNTGVVYPFIASKQR